MNWIPAWRKRRQEKRVLTRAIPLTTHECIDCHHWRPIDYTTGGVCTCADSRYLDDVTCPDDTCPEWRLRNPIKKAPRLPQEP